MFFTDQPGRVLAVFVVGPVLFYKGTVYRDWFICTFAVALILWDLWWLCCKKPLSVFQ